MHRHIELRERWFGLCDRVLRRDYRNFLLRTLPQGSSGCEIGVWRGDFSAEILRIVRPSRLILIDPWLYQPEFAESWYGGKLIKTQGAMDAIHEEVRLRFTGQLGVEILRGKTHNIQEMIAPASLDWVYIDGNHDYDHVRVDLNFAQRAVRLGGLILGDDYDRGGAGKAPPVTRAVTDHLRLGGVDQLWIRRNQFCLRRIEPAKA